MDKTATLEKPYADYAWYTGKYGGTSIAEADFYRSARWASYLVEALTGGRVNNYAADDLPDCVKDAVCAAAELANNYYVSTVSASGGRGMKSESNDGYSISFEDTLSSSASLQNECYAAIWVYLQSIGGLVASRVVTGNRHPRWPV